MEASQTAQPLVFTCPSCQGQIQTPAQFAGVTAPCPYCALSLTAPHPAPVTQWAPAPVPERTSIRRLSIPDSLTEPTGSLPMTPREIRPRIIEEKTPANRDLPPDKLDQLFNAMLALEKAQSDARPRLRRKGKVPFDRPLRRTDDRSMRAFGSRA